MRQQSQKLVTDDRQHHRTRLESHTPFSSADRHECGRVQRQQHQWQRTTGHERPAPLEDMSQREKYEACNAHHRRRSRGHCGGHARARSWSEPAGVAAAVVAVSGVDLSQKNHGNGPGLTRQ